MKGAWVSTCTPSNSSRGSCDLRIVELKDYLRGLRKAVNERGLFDRAAFDRGLRVYGTMSPTNCRALDSRPPVAYLRRSSAFLAKFRYLFSSLLKGRCTGQASGGIEPGEEVLGSAGL
ncbi:MAG: hypothetical protein IPG92_12830 [Flavobacteriales bacterium]|nr:hypothetical protein [Flavobacteriales bacterium]